MPMFFAKIVNRFDLHQDGQYKEKITGVIADFFNNIAFA